MLQLRENKTTEHRFKIHATQEQAYTLLKCCYRAEVEARHRDLIFDKQTEGVLNDVAEWLTDGNGKFGLMLCGNVGNGKTTMLNAIARAIRFMGDGLRIEDATTIAQVIKDPVEFGTIRAVKHLGIDDMGVEPLEVLDYGNVIYPMVELMNYRYARQLLTIVSTNLTPKQIREKYGDRIADRFNEMMHRVVFTNESYRR
jgi:DNA replication protein DnaC